MRSKTILYRRKEDITSSEERNKEIEVTVTMVLIHDTNLTEFARIIEEI